MRHGPRHCRPGSSPLTRGKLDNLTIGEVITRLIPAHAGKTATIRRPTTSLTGSSPLTRGKRRRRHLLNSAAMAHPRSRGENLVSQTTPGTHGGSSPLTRGKQAPYLIGRGPSGLIPAHAGKTGPRCDRVNRAGAHPRSRGENDQGSGLGCRRVGLIPAHAGKTSLR